MPRITIRTGIVGNNGQEEVLTEYLCDVPGCLNVAEHALGVVRDIGLVSAVCREHAAERERRASDFRAG
jgi:hypothetical protein